MNKEKEQKELREIKGNDAVKGTKAQVEQHLGITERRGSNEENKVSKNLIRHIHKYRCSIKKSLYSIVASAVKLSIYYLKYTKYTLYTLCYRVLSHTGQLIQSTGNLWAFYLSVSVSYIWLYIITRSGRASLLNASQCVSRKSRGNLSQHLVEPQSKQKPAHKVSVQSSQVVNNERERKSERQGR